MRRAVVYLIGAGPGDPGLISVRGMQALQSADVVIYDHLVHPALLRHARHDAEKIDVGRAAPQPIDQEAICYLLAEKAREGKTVARLKWGDPFLFDRGGEEALFLHEQRVRFEVVPGIPPGIGIPAYAGVPLTYPGGGDTVTLLRGFEDESRTPPEVDWASLAVLDGTLVCYAGARQLPTILQQLMTNGRPPDEPAVIVYNGTAPTQTTIDGTLTSLVERLQQDKPRGPGLLVVGRVAAFREHLRWFDDRPLFGRRVLVTRPRAQAAELVDLLRDLGADPIEAPMIRIDPPEDTEALERAAAQAAQFDLVVFASSNAVDAFVRQVLAGPGDIRDLKGPRLCAVGPGTAEQLGRYGLRADVLPREFRAEAVVEAIVASVPVAGLKVLLPRADIGREIIAQQLRERGASVTEVIAYRTVIEDLSREGDPDIYRMLLDRQIDVVTFTSGSAVRNFATVFGAEQAADLLQATLVAAIGPVTAEAAAKLGIGVSIQPATYTIAALVDAIAAHFAASTQTS